MCLERQAGFSIVAAIFLLVVLALLGVFIASVTGMQQSSGQLDLTGVRAYQSARAGMEWGASQVLDPFLAGGILIGIHCERDLRPDCGHHGGQPRRARVPPRPRAATSSARCKPNARIPRRRRRGARAVESPTESRWPTGRDRRHGPEHLSQARLGISYRSAQGWCGSMEWR